MVESYTVDQATEMELAQLYPGYAAALRKALLRAGSETGRAMRLHEGNRTYSRQSALYAIGRSLPGKIVTRATSGLSPHHFGIAGDCVFAGPDPFLERLPPDSADYLWGVFGRAAKDEGLLWGGDFRSITDRPHTEQTYGVSVTEMRWVVETAGLAALWDRFDDIRKCPARSFRVPVAFDPTK